jgi:hypothetical protein
MFYAPPLPPGPHTLSITLDGIELVNLTGGPLTLDYVPSTVSGLAPASAPVGSRIELFGNGVYDGQVINFGGATATTYDCFEPHNNDCHVNVPAGLPGVVPVFINTCPGSGACYTSSTPFTYPCPGGDVLTNGHCCPTGEVWSGTSCSDASSCVASTCSQNCKACNGSAGQCVRGVCTCQSMRQCQ